MTTITEQYLNKVYEDLQKEQMALMNDLKTGCGEEKEKDITKQMTQLNTLLMAVLRLRNLKKSIQNKLNC
jgi:hypothetical protein